MQTQLIARILYSIVLTVAIAAFQTLHYSKWVATDVSSQSKIAFNRALNESAVRTVLQPARTD
jgi:hypothetical protein